MYTFGVTAYTLILDEMQDFDYFYVADGTSSYKAIKFTVVSGMQWDGHYVLANDIDAREGYKLVGWTASIDGVSYSAGTELFIAYVDASAITFTAEWAAIIGTGEQKLAANVPYTTDMDAFELEGEGIIYQGDQVFYVPKDGIYVLIESKNDEEVE
jgi:hypothetical protein